MRVGIREQLAVVVLLSALIPLMVLSIAVWVNSFAFITGVTNAELTLTASLKASQIASDLLLIQSTCATIVTRILLQNQLKAYYKDNSTVTWESATNDVRGALASGGYSSLLQTVIFSRNSTGPKSGLLKVTGNITGITLAATYPNGTHAMLGDDNDLGYPTALYPNITYNSTPKADPMDGSVNNTFATAFNDFPLNTTSALLLGPLQVNDSYALVSLTIPMVDNLNMSIVLGYMTVVAAASSLIDVMQSREGLAKTGTVLLIGPSRRENQFRYEERPATATYAGNATAEGQAIVRYVFPPLNPGNTDRHVVYNQNLSAFGSSNFTLENFPAALAGFSRQNLAINNASSMLRTKNENNVSVAVGSARPQSTLVSWLLVVEQSHDEAWEPVRKLREIVLACVFGTFAFVVLVAFPMAHFSVRPIRRLRDATEKSVSPPGYTPNGSIISDRLEDPGDLSGEDIRELDRRSSSHRLKKGIFIRLKRLSPSSRRRKTHIARHEDARRRVFKIPGKVRDRKHWITDELTELTTTFNDMSDELMLQYSSLEQKVAERTQELEISKKAAEAANESKTLFIANISHELKTPLNGILGMCAVCMSEDDLPRIKRSLQVVYKSGDLLLHLLNDLLTFSKNQIGQQLSLEEKEFRLADVKTQITTVFMKQVKEGKINFGVRFIGTENEPDASKTSEREEKVLPALGPQGTGRLKDMCLWGDQHRILQVIINLVSNSLKFTPEGGKVEVRIKCLGEAETSTFDGSRNSMGSKQSSQRNSRQRQRPDSTSNSSQISKKGSTSNPAGTALLINPMDPKATPRINIRERSPTPPPRDAKTFIFQFEVEDTGPGIPPSLRDKVFEPFVQGDLGLSKKYGGTGLGLSICSQLATLMGGAITLDSTEGVGSTFTMKIPLKHTKSRAPSTSSSEVPGSRPPSVYNGDGIRASSPKLGADGSPKSGFDKDSQPRLVGLSQPFFATPSIPSNGKAAASKDQIAALDGVSATKEPGSKLRVLVAEDNLVNQEVVLRMLKLEDIYDVVVANNGQEAYDFVKANISSPFDLIFMDIQMPSLDGLQSTRMIRQMGYSAPIVALTAFAEESNVQECLASGMDMFLSKPIRRPALKQVLKRFAAIPEEVETSSAKSNTTPPPSEPEEPDASSSKNVPPSSSSTHLTNGSPPPS